METINKNMAKGAIWTILFKFVTRGIGLVSTIILARLLVPADFGLVAMVTAIIAALEVMSAFNLDVVLIQKQQAERKHYDAAWSLNLVASALQALVLVILAPLIAEFYGEPRLKMIAYTLALGSFASGFENIGMVAFRKDLQFHKDFQFQVVKKLIGFCVTMFLAYSFRNYWALIGGMLAGTFSGIALSYALQPYRPRFSLGAVGDMFHFSKWLLINNVLTFVSGQSSSFILGKLGGPHALGVFTISREISYLPSTDLVAPINRAIFPGYAKMAENLHTLRQGFLNVLSAIAMLALPIGSGIVLTAEPLVHLLLGDKWVEAIPLVKILAVSGTLTSLRTNHSSVYLALGHPRILTLLVGAQAVLLLPLLILGATLEGAMGAAAAILLVSAILTPVAFMIVHKTLHLHVSKTMKAVWRPLLATALMTAAVMAATQYMPQGTTMTDYLAQILIAAVVGSTTYALCIFISWKLVGSPHGLENLLIQKAIDFFTRKK